jgi:hypothetical protein
MKTLKESKVISLESQEDFWRVVRTCLREFHHADRAALARFSRLRQKIGEGTKEELEIFFHSEPFFVACNIARRDLNVKDYFQRYLKIRDSNGVKGNHVMD